MKRTNRVFYILTVIAVLCCVGFAFSASAADETYTEGIYVYKVQDGVAQITTVLDWNMNGKNYEIPSTLGGYPVKTVFDIYACGVGPVFPESVDHIYFHEPLSHLPSTATDMLRVTILNPECVIEYSSINLNYNRDAVIIGYKGSSAEDFAKTYNKIFVDITKIKNEDGLSYIVENNEAQIVCSENGVDGDLVIPDTLGGYPVTRICETAFAYTSVKSVEIPDGVTEISDFAFGNCNNLESINFSNNLKTIGNSAFALCRKLEKVSFPDSLEKIGDKAFCECGFTKVTIPKNVKTIGVLPFGCCEAEISVNELNGYFSVDEDGVLFNKDKTELIEYPY
ncbi:MAG: leucine-rich repeat domain-containing protein, partial [Acutalibacteraceae bacterium]